MKMVAIQLLSFLVAVVAFYFVLKIIMKRELMKQRSILEEAMRQGSTVVKRDVLIYKEVLSGMQTIVYGTQYHDIFTNDQFIALVSYRNYIGLPVLYVTVISDGGYVSEIPFIDDNAKFDSIIYKQTPGKNTLNVKCHDMKYTHRKIELAFIIDTNDQAEIVNEVLAWFISKGYNLSPI